jgi:two-component system, cell cycle sensor histidine kinase and response regulator CckA
VNTPLRLLHLEDDPVDAELISTILMDGKIPCRSQLVDTRQAFVEALKEGRMDLILADYSIPGFDGMTALTLARQHCPDVPFLFVSATIGEEVAIDAMHQGATDYVLKQRLGRLVPSVQRALRELDDRIERKRAEEALRQSEKQFRQSQKMEAIGRLAGGIAHDFNNLLTVIMGHSQALLMELGTQHPLRGQIQETLHAGERAATLIRQLLTFSRKQSLDPKILSINAAVTSLESLLRRLIGEDITLVCVLDPTNGRLRADESQLEQVLVNLVVNARDAMPKGGTLTIDVARVELTRSPVYQLTPLLPGPYVRLAVSDTGCGMDRKTQSHIFEPFFTTKGEGKGSGLGLSTVYGIVTQWGGAIDVNSQVGYGTRFDVYFPSVGSDILTMTPTQPLGQPQRGTETILLVEDETSVRTLVRDELRKLGYLVLEAKNGIEACVLATQQAESFQLLLTDVVMPGMAGRELSQHLTVINPDLRTLFISGYMNDVGIMAGQEKSMSRFLQKPFTPEMLARTVRKLLDANALSERAGVATSTPSKALR